ncbi:MAG TPA: lysophospholipid acyltransferase family protein [Candidatus Limnocylindrales bacterium]|nr:lysophospholipid acyltransferase family protein [Candidatus Limnocylindrales bacterium]
MGLFVWFAALLSRTALHLLASVKVEIDRDSLPKSGPLIVVANHISNADPPFVAGWLTPALGRQMHILAKRSLFIPVVGFILRRLGASPVKSGGSDIEAYRVALGILERGEILCIFPEGTRSANGEMGEPKPGVAMLATRSGVPILPVGVSGTDRFLGRGQRFPRLRAPITLRVGKPFTVDLDSTRSRREGMQAVSGEIMRRIADLTDERHRGPYGTS